nr:hypothetical protein [Tanacetum cinerariifolium]
ASFNGFDRHFVPGVLLNLTFYQGSVVRLEAQLEDWARAFLSLLRGQVATCLSKGDFPAYLSICYRKKEEESNDFPNFVRKKNQFVRAGAKKQSTEWVPVVHK